MTAPSPAVPGESRRSRFEVTFSVDHGEDGCGDAWDTGSLTAAVLVMLTERFENDGLRVEKITAEVSP